MVTTGTPRTCVSISGTRDHDYARLYPTYIHLLCLTVLDRLDGKMHIGKIKVFAVLGYREVRADVEQGRMVLVHIRPYADEGIVSVDSCGGYKFKREATESVERKEWVHISKMCTYMFQPYGSDMSTSERRKYVKVIPVAKAFVRD